MRMVLSLSRIGMISLRSIIRYTDILEIRKIDATSATVYSFSTIPRLSEKMNCCENENNSKPRGDSDDRRRLT
jgi:hypothetical protein